MSRSDIGSGLQDTKTRGLVTQWEVGPGPDLTHLGDKASELVDGMLRDSEGVPLQLLHQVFQAVALLYAEEVKEYGWLKVEIGNAIYGNVAESILERLAAQTANEGSISLGELGGAVALLISKISEMAPAILITALRDSARIKHNVDSHNANVRERRAGQSPSVIVPEHERADASLDMRAVVECRFSGERKELQALAKQLAEHCLLEAGGKFEVASARLSEIYKAQRDILRSDFDNPISPDIILFLRRSANGHLVAIAAKQVKRAETSGAVRAPASESEPRGLWERATEAYHATVHSALAEQREVLSVAGLTEAAAGFQAANVRTGAESISAPDVVESARLEKPLPKAFSFEHTIYLGQDSGTGHLHHLLSSDLFEWTHQLDLWGLASAVASKFKEMRTDKLLIEFIAEAGRISLIGTDPRTGRRAKWVVGASIDGWRQDWISAVTPERAPRHREDWVEKKRRESRSAVAKGLGAASARSKRRDPVIRGSALKQLVFTGLVLVGFSGPIHNKAMALSNNDNPSHTISINKSDSAAPAPEWANELELTFEGYKINESSAVVSAENAYVAAAVDTHSLYLPAVENDTSNATVAASAADSRASDAAGGGNAPALAEDAKPLEVRAAAVTANNLELAAREVTSPTVTLTQTLATNIGRTIFHSSGVTDGPAPGDIVAYIDSLNQIPAAAVITHTVEYGEGFEEIVRNSFAEMAKAAGETSSATELATATVKLLVGGLKELTSITVDLGRIVRWGTTEPISNKWLNTGDEVIYERIGDIVSITVIRTAVNAVRGLTDDPRIQATVTIDLETGEVKILYQGQEVAVEESSVAAASAPVAAPAREAAPAAAAPASGGGETPAAAPSAGLTEVATRDTFFDLGTDGPSVLAATLEGLQALRGDDGDWKDLLASMRAMGVSAVDAFDQAVESGVGTYLPNLSRGELQQELEKHGLTLPRTTTMGYSNRDDVSGGWWNAAWDSTGANETFSLFVTDDGEVFVFRGECQNPVKVVPIIVPPVQVIPPTTTVEKPPEEEKWPGVKGQQRQGAPLNPNSTEDMYWGEGYQVSFHRAGGGELCRLDVASGAFDLGALVGCMTEGEVVHVSITADPDSNPSTGNLWPTDVEGQDVLVEVMVKRADGSVFKHSILMDFSSNAKLQGPQRVESLYDLLFMKQDGTLWVRVNGTWQELANSSETDKIPVRIKDVKQEGETPGGVWNPTDGQRPPAQNTDNQKPTGWKPTDGQRP